MAIAVGVVGEGHAVVGGCVGEKRAQVMGNGGHLRAYQLDGSGLHGLGAFGGVAHHQNGLA